MKIEEAQKIANKYLELLEPYCRRIEIAGSIRREKLEPKDIEMVAIPKQNPQDFGSFCAVVNSMEKIKGEPTGKYTQRKLPEGINLDLFIANERNWGNIFLIRTGNWQFSRQIMVRVLSLGLRQRDGYLWKGEERLDCKEEEDIFKLLKLDFINPKDRNKENYAF